MSDTLTPGAARLLRLCVLLPAASLLLLELTMPRQEIARLAPLAIPLIAVALLPPLVALPAPSRRWLGQRHLPTALGAYLAGQAILTSLLHNLGLVRLDLTHLGSFSLVEPGLLLLIPALLIAWQYGWRGALLAATAAGALYLATGLALHRLAPQPILAASPALLLRPDWLFILPFVVAYLAGWQRRQRTQQQQAQVQLLRYAVTVEALASERERSRLAERLQESIAGPLATLNARLEAINAALSTAPEAAVDELAKAQEQAHSDFQQAQQVIADLRACSLEKLGLVDAIRTRADLLARRQDVHIDFDACGWPARLTPEQELVLFHMADEALSGVESRQGVQNVTLKLLCAPHYTALTIHDDGVACQYSSQGVDQHGLEDVATCAQLVGGHLCVDSQQNGGTTIALWLPCGCDE